MFNLEFMRFVNNCGEYGSKSEGQIHVHANAYGVRQWRPENILHREIKLLRWAAERWRIECCADQDTIALPEEFQENGTHVEIAHGIPNHCIDETEPVWPPVTENIPVIENIAE